MSNEALVDSVELSERETPATEPLNEPSPELSPAMNRLVHGIQTMEDWYAAKFKERVVEITEFLRVQITDELRLQFDGELKSSTELIRAQFEERLFNAANQWNAERQLLNREIEKLRVLGSGSVIEEEITRVELAIKNGELELDRLINDPSVALSEPMRIKARQVELKAYLNGLRFGIDSADSLPLDKPA